MNHTPPSTPSAAADDPLRQRRLSRRILKELRKAPFSAWFGGIVVLAYLQTAVLAPWLAPYGEAEVVGTP